MRVSRILVLVALALAGVLGSGPGIEHSLQHDLGARLGDAPRFEAGHETPIPERHVETAHGLLDDGCYACAWRHGSSSSAWLGLARERLPGLVGAATAEAGGAFQRHDFSPSLGRAPPA